MRNRRAQLVVALDGRFSRAGSASLIRRFIDPDVTFSFVADPTEIPLGGIPFDMSVEFGYHGDDCTFETLWRRHDLVDPVLWRIAAIVHEADLYDDRYDAPEAAGLDVVPRGLSMINDALSAPTPSSPTHPDEVTRSITAPTS